MTVPHEKGIELLRRQVEEANGGDPEQLAGWKERTATAIRLALGDQHPANDKFAKLRYSPMVVGSGTPQSTYTRARQAGVNSGVAILEAALYELEAIGPGAPSQEVSDAETRDGSIFVIHGHDSGLQNEVAHAIQVLTGRSPIVLHEQADGGRTIIEKFEAHASTAAFAVALLTPDDVGRAVTESDDQLRARQNVVFEAGYFMGRLGRNKVLLLHTPGVELPSDLQGIVYEPIDAAGRWKYELGKELRHAGVKADLNNL